MNLAKWVKRSGAPTPWPSITLDQLPYWFGQFGYQGLGYGPAMIQTIQQNRETIAADFTGFINGAYKTNGAIFACILTRLLLFSEARFQWRRLRNGRPGGLFGTPELDLLERPWPNATTGDLLAKAIVDVDLAGNFYAIRTPSLANPRKPKIARLRPDWVTILLGSFNENPDMASFDPSAELVGYIYTPGGPGGKPGMEPSTFYLPEEVMHWAPIPDPTAHYRGMSWVQPVLNEVLGDRAMITHKLMYFEQGATPNLVVSMDTGKMDRRTFEEWVETFESEHQGALNAYKTLYLGQGAAATVVGTNLKDLDYAVVQGHSETRIAAAAGIPPIIVGFSEGLQAATYSNFAQARRAFSDKTLRPMWRNFCGSMETLLTPPGSAQLWYDDRDIAFLKEDQADEANIQRVKAQAIRLLVDAGYDPDSIVEAVENNDFSRLTHSGMYSVQLRPPGVQGMTSPTGPQTVMPGDAGGNGTGGNGKKTDGSNASTKAPNLASASESATMLGHEHVEELAKALIEPQASG